MKVLSVRYNRNRDEKYKIKTIIFEQNGIKKVKKEPLTDLAKHHINNIYNNYYLLEESSFLLAKPILENDTIVFPFIEGESLDQTLYKYIINKDKDGFFATISWYKSLLENEDQIDFEITESFVEIFGFFSCPREMKALRIPNIDLNFDNIIVQEDKYQVVIDYEWVFDFPIPVNYILFRAILVFYNKYLSSLDNFIEFEEIFDNLKISSNDLYLFDKMEMNFMSYVGQGYSYANYLKANNADILSDYSRQYSSAVSNSEDFIQLFWDTGKGFNELESTKLIIEKTTNFIEFIFELPNTHIKKLRLDPCSSIGLITIKSVTLFTEADILEDISENMIMSYGLKSIHEPINYIFFSINNDPQFIIERQLNQQNLKMKVVIQYSKIYDETQANLMVELIEKNLQKKIDFQKKINEEQSRDFEEEMEQQNKAFEEKMEQLNRNFEDILDIRNRENQKLLEEINGLKNSLSWKLTKPLRKIKKLIRLGREKD